MCVDKLAQRRRVGASCSGERHDAFRGGISENSDDVSFLRAD